jgi:uncharacterized protein YbjT (DUF2867 family)
MTIAITGATGFVGGAVVQRLLRRGHDVRALVREPERAGRLRDLGSVELVAGDLEDAAALRGLMAGAEAAVHLVGIIAEVGRQTFERIHVEGTARFAPVVPIIGDGRYRLQPVWVEDVAEVFAVAVERPDLAGTFDVAGPDQLTWHEMMDLIERALAVTRRRIGVPVSMVRFAAHAGVALPRLSPISPDQLQMLLEGNTTEANAIETVFGVRPRPFGDVVRELCAPYAPAGAGAGG